MLVIQIERNSFRNTAIHLSKLGEEELLKWRSEEADSARQKLLELSGVGPKVLY